MARIAKPTAYWVLGKFSQDQGNKIEEELLEDVTSIEPVSEFGEQSIVCILGFKGKILQVLPSHKIAYIKALTDKEVTKWRQDLKKRVAVRKREKVKGVAGNLHKVNFK